MGQHDKRKAIRRVIFRIGLGFLILIIFSYLLSTNITNIATYEKTIQDVTYSTLLLDLVLQLAKERGLSSIWLASNGTTGLAAVHTQRDKTNDAIAALSGQPATYQAELLLVLNATKFLSLIRTAVDGKNISYDDVLDTYGWMNGVILDRAGKANLSRGTLVRFYLAQEIEMRGLLRGTMSVAFQVGHWTPDLFDRVNTVLAKLDLFQKEVWRYATGDQLAVLETLRSVNETAYAISKATDYLDTALATNSSGGGSFGVSASSWFNYSTAEITCLTVFFQQVSATVVSEAQAAKWWDLLVVVIGVVLELISLGEMVIAVLPIVAFGLKWRDLSWATTSPSTNLSTAPSH